VLSFAILVTSNILSKALVKLHFVEVQKTQQIRERETRILHYASNRDPSDIADFEMFTPSHWTASNAFLIVNGKSRNYGETRYEKGEALSSLMPRNSIERLFRYLTRPTLIQTLSRRLTHLDISI
jgi:hypothetical protein